MSETEKDTIILELQKRVDKLEGKNEEGIPTYSFSSIKYEELETIVSLKKSFDDAPFENWLESDIDISLESANFLETLLGKYGKFIQAYKEETLKANFIIPIINQVDFLSIKDEISPFYEEIITYKTENFILSGATDFSISKGLEYSKKPYFFIQEFKKGKVSSDPEPQLLAELISAVELNQFQSMKGAYIVGAIWNFVILEKIGTHKYRYNVSRNFDSTDFEKLKGIYKNLLFIKNEILEMVRKK